MRLGTFFAFVHLVFACSFAFAGPQPEKLGRGLVALEQPGRSVFCSWRLLETDPQNVRFELVRTWKDAQGLKKKIVTEASGIGVTNCVDKLDNESTVSELTYELSLVKDSSSRDKLGQVTIAVTGKSTDYIRIPLQGDYDFQKVGVADLDGDGEYEYIIKQPKFNTDPYQKEGYWKKSTTTYKIEAYKLDGTMMWRHDMGWSIEAGIWYSPYIVYDIDGDGKAEVYCKGGEGDPRDEKGLVQTGPEYLLKLDGATGKLLSKIDWIPRDGYGDYNWWCRNFLAVAYLDGVKPSLIMQRGTYGLIKTLAIDKDLKQIWLWQCEKGMPQYEGQGSHGLATADIDADGKDELVIGSAALDDNGTSLWTTELGHPDMCYVADIDPCNPGLEIFYGIEPGKKTNGICVADAKTGKILWGHQERTFHIHNQGMIGDLLPEYPGMEVYAGEKEYQRRWLYSAKGDLIKFLEEGPLSPKAVWWNSDEQKEVVFDNTIHDNTGIMIQEIEGDITAVVDCVGDWREELITSTNGQLRIYTTTMPTSQKRACLMQDRQYRLGVAAQTMGYYYPAQLGQVTGRKLQAPVAQAKTE
jgi:rhamnogalacturonan endolyase